MLVSKNGRVFKNLESYSQARAKRAARGLDVTTSQFHNSITLAKPLRIPRVVSPAKYKGLNP